MYGTQQTAAAPEADLPRRTHRSGVLSRGGGVGRRLTIFNKVLIANVAIVVFGAVAGTWITIFAVRHETDQRFYPLALLFAVVGIFLSLGVNLIALRAAFRPLARLQQAAMQVRQGDYSVRADGAAFGDPEIQALAETLNGTLDKLALDRIELDLLASQVIRAQEDERQRIARELHDDTAQVLFAQLLRLSALKGAGDPAVSELAASLEEMTSEALESVRRLALELRPPALDDLGLHDALGELVQRCSDQLSIPVDYQVHGVRSRLAPEIELVLYRIAQEALLNVAKHARATAAWVDLERSATDVTLSVRDDGDGFDTTGAAKSDGRGLGLGLFGMEERATLVGGRLRVWSGAGKGTEVYAYIPLDQSFAESASEFATLRRL